MKIDQYNKDILRALQGDSDISQRSLSEKVNLSPNACWHRVQAMRKNGVITGQTARLDRKKLNLNLVVFVMLRTRHHSSEWLGEFSKQVEKIPEVIDFYRLGGDYDYFLKVVTKDMESYDSVYQRLINGMEFDTITSHFAMEAISEQRPLPLNY